MASTTGSSKLALPHFTGSNFWVGIVFSQSVTSDKDTDLQIKELRLNFCRFSQICQEHTLRLYQLLTNWMLDLCWRIVENLKLGVYHQRQRQQINDWTRKNNRVSLVACIKYISSMKSTKLWREIEDLTTTRGCSNSFSHNLPLHENHSWKSSEMTL